MKTLKLLVLCSFCLIKAAGQDVIQPCLGNTVLFDSKNVTCFGKQDGSITIKNDDTNTVYKLLDKDGVFSSKRFWPDLESKSFILHVKRPNENICSVQIEITSPKKIEIQSDPKFPDCNLNNGGIDLKITGGSSPFNLTLKDINKAVNRQPVITDEKYSFKSLSPGLYGFSATDKNNCLSTDFELFLNSTNNFKIKNLTIDPVTQCAGNGKFKASLEGGSLPYTIQVNRDNNLIKEESIEVDGQYVYELDRQAAYTFTIKDKNTCTYLYPITPDKSLTKLKLKKPTLFTPPTFSDKTSGTIRPEVEEGLGPFNFTLFKDGNPLKQYDPIASKFSPPFNNLVTGTYNLKVTGKYGCIDEEEIKLILDATFLTNKYNQLMRDYEAILKDITKTKEKLATKVSRKKAVINILDILTLAASVNTFVASQESNTDYTKTSAIISGAIGIINVGGRSLLKYKETNESYVSCNTIINSLQKEVRDIKAGFDVAKIQDLTYEELGTLDTLLTHLKSTLDTASTFETDMIKKYDLTD